MIPKQFERLSNYAGLIVILLGVISVLAIEFMDKSFPAILTRYGSFFLILVTLGYVVQNGQILRETKRERELTRQSLIEVRKGPVVQLIVQGIDPILRDLRDDNDHFNTSDEWEDYNHLTYLHSQVTFPDDEITRDIERKVSGLNDELREYEQNREQYREHWFALRDRIRKKLPRNLDADTQSDLVESLQEVDMGHKTELEDLALSRIENQSDTLANLVLDPSINPETSKGWVMDDLEHVRESLQCVWEDGSFTDELNKLERQQGQLIQKNAEIRQELNKARDEFKDEWDIWESEIGKVSQDNSESTERIV